MRRFLFVDFDFKVFDKNLIEANFENSLFIDHKDLENIIKIDNGKNNKTDFTNLYLEEGFLSKFKSILNAGILRHYSYAKYNIVDLPDILDKINNISYFLNKEKISEIIFNNIPHENPEYLLLTTAKIIKIETLSFYQVAGYLPGFVTAHKNAIFNEKLIYNKDLSVKKNLINLSKEYLDRKLEKPYYVPKKSKLTTYTQFNNLFDSLYVVFSSLKKFSFTKTSHALGRMFFNIKSLHYYKKKFKPNSISEIKKEFVYLPLQHEPELSSTVIYKNQVITAFEMVLLAREKFDKTIQLVCKENPASLLFNRSPDFFKLISNLENTIYLADGSHDYLIKNCLSVIVGRSTPGYEGVLIGKPVFGVTDNWYYENLIKNLFSKLKYSLKDIYKIKTYDQETVINTISNNVHQLVVTSEGIKNIKEFNISLNTNLLINIIRLWLNETE